MVTDLKTNKSYAAEKPERLYSIDMLKGICMFWMLIDHWRIHLSYMGKEILGAANTIPINAGNLENVGTASFWLLCLGSHFVAPSFLFLAGAGSYLWQVRRGADAKLHTYLWQRGFMLAIINCLLFFQSPFSEGGVITLHVLWPAGIGMMLLGCIAKWPKALLWLIVLACSTGQSYFESISFSSPIFNTLWTFAFIEAPIALPWGASLYNLWPIMPWFSMLLLGYLCAPIFTMKQKSCGIWAKLGLGCLTLFLFLRFTGIYGDPSLWQIQDTWLKTLGDIITVSKYPPSLQYTLYGLSITFLLLATLERFKLKNTMLITLGSAPLFFYIVHTETLRVIKFILLRLPSSFMENIQDMLFSLGGILIPDMLMTPIFAFISLQYKNIMKKYKQKKKNTQHLQKA